MSEKNAATLLLDDIRLMQEDCPESEIDCQFEGSFCGFRFGTRYIEVVIPSTNYCTQIFTNHFFWNASGHQLANPWLVGTGKTHRMEGIVGDHTTGSGMFAYVDFSFAIDNIS